VLPHAIKRIPGTLYKGGSGEEILTYDAGPIIMALVNACKELEKQIIELQTWKRKVDKKLW